jgi:hypothetical protein
MFFLRQHDGGDAEEFEDIDDCQFRPFRPGPPDDMVADLKISLR